MCYIFLFLLKYSQISVRMKSNQLNEVGKYSTLIFRQNFYASSKFGKTLQRNVNYRVFFYNRLDLTELRHISLQITPNNSTFLQSCFNFLTDSFPNHSNYVLVDGHYRSKMSQMMVRSNIFPDPESGEIRPIIFFSNPNQSTACGHQFNYLRFLTLPSRSRLTVLLHLTAIGSILCATNFFFTLFTIVQYLGSIREINYPKNFFIL